MSGPACPECGGALWCDVRLGLLAHHDDTCDLGREEVEQAADDRAACGAVTTQSPHRGYSDGRNFGRLFVRAITSAEVRLLLAAGADPGAAHRSQVGVHFLAGGVRRRVFTAVQVSTLAGMPLVDPRLVA